ncbi:3238_t:CDS:1, partial [Paraglomus occultum]
YLSGANSVGKSHQTLTLRKQVAEVLGVAERTVASVVSDWNKQDGTFTLQKVLGRPKFLPDKNVEIIDWLTTHNLFFLVN